jgi:hypothetical protein
MSRMLLGADEPTQGREMGGLRTLWFFLFQVFLLCYGLDTWD